MTNNIRTIFGRATLQCGSLIVSPSEIGVVRNGGKALSLRASPPF